MPQVLGVGKYEIKPCAMRKSQAERRTDILTKYPGKKNMARLLMILPVVPNVPPPVPGCFPEGLKVLLWFVFDCCAKKRAENGKPSLVRGENHGGNAPNPGQWAGGKFSFFALKRPRIQLKFDDC